MGKIAVILDEAKKVGLKIVLQAGYMPAACPDLPREYALSYIKPIKTDELRATRMLSAPTANGVIPSLCHPPP
jgi:hypothetical protein